MKEAPYLQVSMLSCECNDHLLFSNLHFSLSPGEMLHIVGPNGSGKSTLLRCLAGISTLATGVIEWCPPHHGIYIGHQNAVKPVLNIRENIESMRIVSKNFNASRIPSVLTTLALPETEVPVQQLSAGQQRRLGLARLLLEDAAVWMLDEPYAALDNAGSEILNRLLAAHVQKQGAVLFTSHQPVVGAGVRKMILGDAS